MAFRHAPEQLLRAPILLKALFDLEDGGAGARLIGFVDHNDVGQIEHDNFLQLQRDLVAIEDQLQQARNAYNQTVLEYNTSIQNFPLLLFARPFGFLPAEFCSVVCSDATRPGYRCPWSPRCKPP